MVHPGGKDCSEKLGQNRQKAEDAEFPPASCKIRRRAV